MTGSTWACSAIGGATCTARSSGDIADTLASFPEGGVVTYTVVGGLDAVGQVANTTAVTPPAGVADPNPDNNAATVSTQAVCRVLSPLILRDHWYTTAEILRRFLSF